MAPLHVVAPKADLYRLRLGLTKGTGLKGLAKGCAG